ncbi:MAG: 2OG-Fe(II) oxygenase [Bdellovibrionota bacterium]
MLHLQPMNSEKLAQELADQGFGFDPRFIEAELSDGLLTEAICARENGQFKAAGIGKNSQHVSEIRRDEILWIEPKAEFPFQNRLFDRLEIFRQDMNRKLFLGLDEFEAHFAHYDSGAFYQKHLDRFRNDDRRALSMVIYLNRDWNESDGGLLRLYSKPNETTVVPEAGSMICFKSDELEHEVTLSRRPRWSVAVWFKTKSNGGVL